MYESGNIRSKDQFKLLIIDDHPVNLEMMVAIFENFRPEYTVYPTSKPENALNLAIQTKPDLIITDWDMPVLNGLQVIEALKKEKATQDIPVIVATGVHISAENLQTALEVGAIDFIRKPFDPIELVARAQSVIHSAKNHLELINIKNQELTENSLYLIKNNCFKNELQKQLQQVVLMINENPDGSRILIKNIINQINSHIQEESWYKFNVSFDKVHGDFRKNLLHKHPDLTGLDIKLCTFIRLGLNNKDIASLLTQTHDSIKVSRSRLRKKMNLATEQNLEGYLGAF